MERFLVTCPWASPGKATYDSIVSELKRAPRPGKEFQPGGRARIQQNNSYNIVGRYKMAKGKNLQALQESEYLALAEFRYQLRRFLRFMEDEVRDVGINPQQWQLVLAVKGLPRGQRPTISQLAERMQLNHNSMVELVDRCEEHGL